MTKRKQLNEEDLMLRLNFEDPSVDVSPDMVDVEVVGGEDEEEVDMEDLEDEMGGEEMSVDEPDEMEMEMGGMYENDETESDEEDLSEGLDDDAVSEIDENALRDELKRMMEVDASALDDFGGGSPKGEPFVDTDDDDLNVLDDTGGSTKKTQTESIFRKEFDQMKEDLREHENIILKLQRQLTEMNLFNAKLLYTNKLMRNRDLSAKQVKHIVESMNKAKTLREVKLLYSGLTESYKESLDEGKKKENKTIKETVKNKLGSSSKAVKSSAAKQMNENKKVQNAEFNRWSILAGLENK